MTRLFRPAILAGLLLALAPGAAADVVITEKTTATSGSRSADGIRSTSIKGSQMRIESVQGDESKTTLFDLPGGVTVELDAKKKRRGSRNPTGRSATFTASRSSST